MNLVALLSLTTLLSPLLGSVIAGLAGHSLGKRQAQRVTILLMMLSFIAACWVLGWTWGHTQPFTYTIYEWGYSGGLHFTFGILLDRLTAVMMAVVTFIALLVHVYSVGYMVDDPGNPRFFSYMSLFTFMMLLLVTANNFFQLFVGWEGVGLVSYLLIGFWFYKESANRASLKAFIVNRVGDTAFLIGLAAILEYFGSLDYQSVFSQAGHLTGYTMSIIPGLHGSVLTVICVLLFIGAMGKSAQIPLHIWLPGSMEGPTPISALIHAATMVTAGVFMVTRLSPLFEQSPFALTVVLVVGATGALLLGLLAFVEYDIKRIIAYSTLSQLGYMMAANGASAFSASIFHLMTHACFKALLFLAAGAVITATRHQQDLRQMGNLRRYMPITYISFLVGALALSAIPPFSGYYSKDAIIEAVHWSSTPGSGYAYYCLLLATFVTGFYIFRAFFMVFHTHERMTEAVRIQLKEAHWTLLLPIVILSIASIAVGGLFLQAMLYTQPGLTTNLPPGIVATTPYPVLWHSWHGLMNPPFFLSILGIVSAWVLVIHRPHWPTILAQRFAWLRMALVKQYGFDHLSDQVIARGGRGLARFFFHSGELKWLDQGIVDGAGRTMTRIAHFIRRLQTGYLSHYLLIMVIALVGTVYWVWR